MPRGALAGPRRTTIKAHAEIAESAKAFMAMRCAERLTIEDVSRHVHVSPFHLCRLFRKHAGLPIHRYLNRLRLRVALAESASVGHSPERDCSTSASA